jgi:hypothetical protein
MMRKILEITAYASSDEPATFNRIQELTGLSTKLMKKYELAEKLKGHIAINDDLSEALQEFDGKHVKITIEED